VPATALPGQVVHGDVRLGNVARTPDGRTAFLDFGFAARRPRIHDLAYSLSWIVLRPDDSGTGADFAWERRLPELVSAYEDGAHRALEPLERQALVPYLAAVPLALACVAGFTPTPVANLRDQQPFVAIAEWVLANLA
jgi:Ser/Thr protein kinase RdoA (MazF antagonist)